MQTRRLGNTDLDLTVIGLGTWAIGGAGWDFSWGSQSEADSISTIHEALDYGINWIDTAAAYGLGQSERVIAKALKGSGKSAIIATKCGLWGDSKGRISRCLKKSSIMNEIDNSLRNLKVDTIDLYQIHWPMPEEQIEEGFETLLELKEKGKIRWAAVSNFSLAQLELISKIGPVASLQPRYHILDRRIEDSTLEWCKVNNCGVICYSPMACGLLTGKVTPEWVAGLPTDDWRKTKSTVFSKENLPALLGFIEDLKLLASESDHTVAQLAVSWVIKNPAITAAIVGARKPGQIAQIAPAANWNLSENQLGKIENLLEKHSERLGPIVNSASF